MRIAQRLAIAAIIGLSAVPAAATAAIIDSGSYGAGDNVFSGGSFGLEPGRYRFTLDLAGPVDDLLGSVSKTTTTNEFCDFGDGEFFCGGNDVPTIPLLEPAGANRYEAWLTIDAPYEILTPGQLVVRSTVMDQCCDYQFSFTAAGAGQYLFSYNAVPEPATWTLMIAGIGLAGAALRRGRRPERPHLA